MISILRFLLQIRKRRPHRRDIIMLSIYIDKNGQMIFVPCKKTVAGYRLATEPYRIYEAEEVNCINSHIKKMMAEIAIDPIIADVSKAPSVMKKICGKKSYTQFSKEHICIDIGYDVQEKTYIISNSPRLSDGSYGVRKNSLSEQYSTEFVCSCDDAEQVRKNFLRAYAEAQNYLYAIGESKEPAIDFEFGHKTMWIAVKDVSIDYILENKRLVNIEQLSWDKGLDVVENDEDLLEGKYDDICEEDVLKIASIWCINPEKIIGAREKNCYIADFSAMEEEMK